jgi:hypothetical protein
MKKTVGHIYYSLHRLLDLMPRKRFRTNYSLAQATGT